MICDYGCEQEATYQFKNGKWCCSSHYTKCSITRNKLKQKIPWNKGKKLPEEIRIKIKNNRAIFSGNKNGMYGKKHSNKSIDKIRKASSGKRNGMYGKKHSDETRIKISISCKASLNKSEVKEKMIQCNTGENNPNWRGGIMCAPYCQVWSDQEYKDSIKERDTYICLNPMCGRKSKNLCLHHINYNKKNCHPNNLITLCLSCNSKANTNREWHTEWYKRILNRRYNYE